MKRLVLTYTLFIIAFKSIIVQPVYPMGLMPAGAPSMSWRQGTLAALGITTVLIAATLAYQQLTKPDYRRVLQEIITTLNDELLIFFDALCTYASEKTYLTLYYEPKFQQLRKRYANKNTTPLTKVAAKADALTNINPNKKNINTIKQFCVRLNNQITMFLEQTTYNRNIIMRAFWNLTAGKIGNPSRTYIVHDTIVAIIRNLVFDNANNNISMELKQSFENLNEQLRPKIALPQPLTIFFNLTCAPEGILYKKIQQNPPNPSHVINDLTTYFSHDFPSANNPPPR